MPSQPPNTLSNMALTTLDQVKLYIAKDDLKSDADDRLTWLINVASVAAASYTSREFVATSGSSSVPRQFEIIDGGVAGAIVNLAPFDLQSIQSVTVANPSGTSATLTSSYYQPGPIHKPFGVYSYVKMSTWQVPVVSAANMNLSNIATITGVWGWPDIPKDVENAVITAVKKWHDRDMLTPSPEFDISPGFQETPQGMNLPYDARVLLQRYKRAGMA